MEWVLDTIIRYRLLPFITTEEAATIPALEACEGRVRARVAEDRKKVSEKLHLRWDSEELDKVMDDAVHRAAIEERADPVARILARFGWLEPLRPEKARS